MKKYLLFILYLIIIDNTIAQDTKPLIIASGIERGSYNTIANDIKRLVETEMLSLERRLERYEDDLFDTDKTDSVAIEKLNRRIERLEDDLKELKALNIEVLKTNGSTENFDLVAVSKKADIAFLQYDVFVNKQIEDIENGTYYTEDLRIVFPLGYEQVHLIAAKDSRINKLSDLKEKRVAIGSNDSGTSVTAKTIKKKTEGEWYDVPISFENSFSSLINSTVEALFFVGAVPVERFDRLPKMAKEKIKIVPIENDALSTEGGGFYKKYTIKPTMYKWANYETPTFAVRSIIVTSISGETPKDRERLGFLFEFIYENIEKLKERGHPVWKQVDFDYKDLDIQIHEDVELILSSF